MSILLIVGKTKAENVLNDETSTQELIIDPTPVLYIAKYNHVIDTSQIFNGDEVKEEVSEKSINVSTIEKRYLRLHLLES